MEFFKNIKKPSIYELFTAGFILKVAIDNGGRGSIWITVGDKVLETADVYQKMQEIFPIETWGLLFLISGLFMFIAAFTQGNIAYFSLIFGGLFGTFCNSMFYMASTIAGLNLYTPFNSAVDLITNVAFTFAGGVLFWIERKKQNS